MSVWKRRRIRRLQSRSSRTTNARCFDSPWKTLGGVSEGTTRTSPFRGVPNCIAKRSEKGGSELHCNVALTHHPRTSGLLSARGQLPLLLRCVSRGYVGGTRFPLRRGGLRRVSPPGIPDRIDSVPKVFRGAEDRRRFFRVAQRSRRIFDAGSASGFVLTPSSDRRTIE